MELLLMRNLTAKLALAFSLLFSHYAHADYQGNWLWGLSAGEAWRDGVFYANSTDGEIFNVGYDYHDQGLIWGMLTGYQGRCNGWLVGGEVHVDWDRARHTHEFDFAAIDDLELSSSVEYRRTVAYGFTGRVGFEALPYFLPYIRFGFEASKDKIFATIENTDFGFVIDTNNGRRVYRILAGLGFEVPFPVLMGLSLRVEYDYHSKGRKVQLFEFSRDATTFLMGDMQPRTNTVRAAFVWNFV